MKTKPLPDVDLDLHLAMLRQLHDEAGRLFDSNGTAEAADRFSAYRRHLSDAASELLALTSEIGPKRPPRPTPQNKRKPLAATSLWILRTALEWRAFGLSPTAGREGAQGFRVSPFQSFMWSLQRRLPPDVRPWGANRVQFADMVEAALRHMKRHSVKSQN